MLLLQQELQYADLADFAPSKRAAHQAPPTSSTKPMPIEEVRSHTSDHTPCYMYVHVLVGPICRD